MLQVTLTRALRVRARGHQRCLKTEKVKAPYSAVKQPGWARSMRKHGTWLGELLGHQAYKALAKNFT